MSDFIATVLSVLIVVIALGFTAGVRSPTSREFSRVMSLVFGVAIMVILASAILCFGE